MPLLLWLSIYLICFDWLIGGVAGKQAKMPSQLRLSIHLMFWLIDWCVASDKAVMPLQFDLLFILSVLPDWLMCSRWRGHGACLALTFNSFDLIVTWQAAQSQLSIHLICFDWLIVGVAGEDAAIPSQPWLSFHLICFDWLVGDVAGEEDVMASQLWLSIYLLCFD